MTDPRIWQAQIDGVREAVQAMVVKPHWRLVSATADYYHFVNRRTTGIGREMHTITRAEFWGRAQR